MIFRFVDFVLDVEKRELRRGSAPVELEPQVFDLLAFLVRSRERVVSRDEIIAAVWSGRIVSESTLSSRINAARTAIGDDGASQRLIRTFSRKGFRFVGDVAEMTEVPEPLLTVPQPLPRVAPGPDGPAIAVLPFANLTGDSESDYFADGMTEEITTALAKCGGILVIARNSAFTFKGQAVDVRDVGRDLGVGYVLEGSVRRSSGQLRITAQLIDATTGTHLWADRFDGSLGDVFDLQDRIAESVVAIIEPKLRLAEVERATRAPTQDLNAYDLWLQAIAHVNKYTSRGLGDALQCLERALALDPTYALAMATAAFCHAQRFLNQQVNRPEASKSVGLKLARRAVDLARDDPNVQWMAAYAIWVLELDTEGARELFRRSLLTNPNSPLALTMDGWVEAVNGNAVESRKLIERAMRLNPRHPDGWLMSVGMAFTCIAEKNYVETGAWAEKALTQNRHSTIAMRALIVALVNSDRLEPARQVMKRLLSVEPELTITAWRASVALVKDDYVTLYANALRKAGLPE